MKNSTEKKSVKSAIIFLLKYIGFIVAYYCLAIFLNSFIDSYIAFTAYLSSFALKLFDSSVYAQKDLIVGQNLVLSLAYGCEGIEPIIIFLAFVFAFPAKIKNKLIGGSIGAISLYFINFVRIGALYLIGKSAPKNIELFHQTIFPILFIIIAIILIFVYLKWTINKSQNTKE